MIFQYFFSLSLCFSSFFRPVFFLRIQKMFVSVVFFFFSFMNVNFFLLALELGHFSCSQCGKCTDIMVHVPLNTKTSLNKRDILEPESNYYHCVHRFIATVNQKCYALLCVCFSLSCLLLLFVHFRCICIGDRIFSLKQIVLQFARLLCFYIYECRAHFCKVICNRNWWYGRMLFNWINLHLRFSHCLELFSTCSAVVMRRSFFCAIEYR